jgi:cytochrome b561
MSDRFSFGTHHRVFHWALALSFVGAFVPDGGLRNVTSCWVTRCSA